MERLESSESVHRSIEGALGHLWFVHNDYIYHRQLLSRDIAAYDESNPSYGTYLKREIAHLEAQVEKARALTEEFMRKTLPQQLVVSGTLERRVSDGEYEEGAFVQGECTLAGIEVLQIKNEDGTESFAPLVHLVQGEDYYRGAYQDIAWDVVAAQDEVA